MDKQAKWQWFASAKAGNLKYIENNIMLTEQYQGIQDTELQNTALMYATINNYSHLAQLLMPYEKCRQNKYGWTALHMAAYNGALECVKLLAPVEAGLQTVSDFKQIPSRSTALQIAMQRGYIDCAIELIQEVQIARVSDEHLSTIHGGSKYPLQVENDSLMRTPLHYLACINIKVSYEVFVAYYKLYCGYRDVNGMTSLMLAAQQNNYVFIEHALNINTTELKMFSNAGFTALMIATFSRSLQAALTLAKYEGGLQNNQGLTAMMLAAKYGQLEIVKTLYSKERRMQTKEQIQHLEKGSCALSFAKYYGFKQIYQFLYQGENDVLDDSGHNSLDIPTDEKSAAMQELICKSITDSQKMKCCRSPNISPQIKNDGSPNNSLHSGSPNQQTPQQNSINKNTPQQRNIMQYTSPQQSSLSNGSRQYDALSSLKSNIYKITNKTASSWHNSNIIQGEISKPNISQVLYTEIVARPDLGVETEISEFPSDYIQQSYILKENKQPDVAEESPQAGDLNKQVIKRKKLVQKYRKRDLKLQYDGDDEKIRKCVESINLNGSSVNIKEQLDQIFTHIRQYQQSIDSQQTMQQLKASYIDQMIQTDDILFSRSGEIDLLDRRPFKSKSQDFASTNSTQEQLDAQQEGQISDSEQLRSNIANLQNQLNEQDSKMQEYLKEQNQYIQSLMSQINALQQHLKESGESAGQDSAMNTNSIDPGVVSPINANSIDEADAKKDD